MTTLMVQTFLLLLTAFFAGATLACLLRRLISGRRPSVAQAAVAVPAAQPAAMPSLAPAPAPAATARFEQALTGAPSPAAAAAPKPAPAPAPQNNTFSPVVVGVAAAAAAAAARQEAANAAAAASAPAPKVVEPAPPRIMLPAAAGTSGANVVAAEVIAAPASSTPNVPPSRDPAPVPEPTPPPPSAPEPAPAPAPVPQQGAVAMAADDLSRIRGIDADTQARLAALGIASFAAIAGWKTADVKNVTSQLGLDGRIERENWIEQAQILAKGAETHYSSRRKQGDVALASPPADEGRTPMPAAPAASAPAPAPVAAVPQAADSAADRLTRVHGIDADIERQLNQWGVTRFAQVAAWSPPEVARFEALLQRPGRIDKENWVGQAQVLSRAAAEAPMPSGLGDTLRANAASTPVEAAAAEVPSEAGKPAEAAKAGRADLANLRSVKSEALIGGASRGMNGFDDLKRIRGIGVLIEKKLNSLGVSNYDQVANWTRGDIDRISQLLDFKGRIERENWVEQARILASGGHTEFSRRLERQDA